MLCEFLMGSSIGDIDVFMDGACFSSLPYVEDLRFLLTGAYEKLKCFSVYTIVYKGRVSKAQVTNSHHIK